jgi:ribose transport system substrate-binding protein
MLNWIKLNFHWVWRILLITMIGLSLIGLASLPINVQKKSVKIIAVCKAPATNIAFWWSINSGLKAAAREFDVSVIYRAPIDESHVDQQIEILYEAIKEKPDVIILAALDKTRLVEPARAARIAGIKLIMVDSTIESGDNPVYDCFVATDNIAAGEKLGTLVSDLLPHGEKILIVTPSARGDSLIDREKGVRSKIQNLYTFLPTIDVQGGSSSDVYLKVTAALADYPDIGGIVCLNEYTTAGAARAIRGAGLTGRVKLVGFDSSEELIDYLEEGLLSAIVIQRPFNMGYLSVVRSLDVIARRPVNLFYDTGSIVITKDTMFQEENEKLLFPFE